MHTYESYNKDAEEDPESVADDVHEVDGGEGDALRYFDVLGGTFSCFDVLWGSSRYLEVPEGIADDVHEDDGGEGDGKAHLSQPLATLSPAEDVPCSPDERWKWNRACLLITISQNYQRKSS